MVLTPHAFDIAAESVGFMSSIALSWQSFRLLRQLRAVRDLRRVEERRPGQKSGELAGRAPTNSRKPSDAGRPAINGSWSWDSWGLLYQFLLKLVGLTSTKPFRVEQSVEHSGTINKIFLWLIIRLTPESRPKSRDFRGRPSP
jgi:hypothetical protein